MDQSQEINHLRSSLESTATLVDDYAQRAEEDRARYHWLREGIVKLRERLLEEEVLLEGSWEYELIESLVDEQYNPAR